MSEGVKNPKLAKVFEKLANIKILGCLRNWLLEQKHKVE